MNHSNTDSRKRVELHCHTKSGSIGAVNRAAEIIKAAREGKMSAVAITDVGVAYAFPEAAEARESEPDFFKVIYGMETRLLRRTPECRKKGGYSVVVLAQNEIGKRNLYHLITDCSRKPAAVSRPKVSETELANNREGLLIGSAGEDGEVFQAILDEKNGEELQKIAAFYDYLEIKPVSRDDPELAARTQAVHQKIVELGDLLHIPVIASSNAYLLDARDAPGWKILRRLKGIKTAANAIPPHFRTTEEMLDEFCYLGREKAAEVVITNTNRIADKIEAIRPIPSGRHLLRAPDSSSSLRKRCIEKARELYGNPLPEAVASRLNRELETIIRTGYGEALLLVQKIVQKSAENAYGVMPRGALGSSFAAYLLGIAEENPLPAHYRCEKCCCTDFASGAVLRARSGTDFDLPDKRCPRCGAPLRKDGLNLSFAFFAEPDDENLPELSLSFSGEYLPEINRYAKDLSGEAQMLLAGTVQTIKEPSAKSRARWYLGKHGVQTDETMLSHLSRLFEGSFSAQSNHPQCFFLIPENMDVYDFTPLYSHPRAGKDAFASTHFDARALRNTFLRISLLGHSTPTMIHRLQTRTGVDPAKIPLDDGKVLSLFSSPAALGLKPADLCGFQTGTLGVPEFNSDYAIELLSALQPKQFSDLICVNCLMHGADAQEMPRDMAQRAAYTAAAWRIAFYKLYYPQEFYAAYFDTMPCPALPATVYRGMASLDAYIAQQHPAFEDSNDPDMQRALLVMREMYARGFAFGAR